MTRLYCLAVALCFSLLSFAQAGNPGDHVPGELIVMFEKGVNPYALTGGLTRATSGQLNLDIAEALSPQAGIYLLRFDAASMDETEMERQVFLTQGVRAVQKNYYVEMRETIPNDPQFGQQWHHRNTGQTGGTVGADVRTSEAWDITTGGQTTQNDDIVVCIIEGANMNHPDLTDNHWVNTQEIPGNGIDDDGNGYVDDYNGWNPSQNNDNVLSGNHGTSVAGMIGAKGDNNLGVAGANWDVKMMVVTVGSLTTSNVLASYNYPYVMRQLYNQTNGAQGAFVVATNASWGIDGGNPDNFPVWCEFYDIMGEEGILSCGATANNNVNIDNVGDMPTGCTSPYLVSVTATNHNDVRTFSGFGVNSIQVAAPGEAVRTTSGSNNYTTTSGTSFATPLTAGVIALLYSAPCEELTALAKSNPQAAADLVRNALYDGVDVKPNLINEVSTGGRINAFNSLNIILDNCNDNPCQPNVSASTDVNCGNNTFSITVDIENNEVVGQYNVLASVNGGANTTVVSNQPQGQYTFGNYPLGSSVDLTIVFIGDSECNASINNITANAVLGCTNSEACNFNPDATCDDGSCETENSWYVDADGDGFGDENDTNPVCGNPCDGTIVVTISGSGWLDEVNWTLSDVSGSTILSGGPYNNNGNGGTFTSDVNSTNGPFTFEINTQGQFNDNAASYSVATGNGLVLENGNVSGGTVTTVPGINCSYANNNDDCDDSNPNVNPNVPGSCEEPPCFEPAVRVTAPQGQAGLLAYTSAEDSGWGATVGASDIAAPAVLVNDGSGSPDLGCGALINGAQISGNIAVAFRGSCQFSEKAFNAQNAGAAALVIINNTGGAPTAMAAGNFAGQINIPVVMISQAAGQALLADLNSGNVVMFIGNDCAELDCNGDLNGSAFFDSCGNCVGGNTGEIAAEGCTDALACNYDPNANCDNGTCQYFDDCNNCGGSSTAGCTDQSACNYDASAGCDDGSCEFTSCAGCTDPTACNFDNTASLDDGSCILPDGCTDPEADNFDPNATCDDGSCTYPCTGVTFTFTTDCWGEETGWTLTDDAGGTVASVAPGTYASTTTFTWSDCLPTGCYTMTITDAYGDGVNGSQWGGCTVDGSYVMTDSNGSVIFEIGDPDFGFQVTHEFCVPQPTEGCTNPLACNYDPSADNDDGSCLFNDACGNCGGTDFAGCTNINACNYDPNAGCDDGSCEFISCQGCTDPAACNFDNNATIDDGSCLFNDACGNCGGTATAGCTDVNACNYDGSASCDDGSCEYTSCAGCTDPAACNYDNTATIDDGSCLFNDVCGNCGGNDTAGCTDPGACNYDVSAGCDDGSCEYNSCEGCTDPAACNYDSSATIDDGSCLVDDACGNCGGSDTAGCTDLNACNYDPSAGCDDGSCEYISCAGCTDLNACNYDPGATLDDGSCDHSTCTCWGDFNEDGERNVLDLLIMIAEFGCENDCESDMNGDGTVSTADMLLFLGVYGQPCE